MQFLRQSTGVDVRMGMAVAVGDAFTPVTTLSLSTADEAELLKHNGAATVDISGATMAAVTSCDGWYDLTLTTSHTDTLGLLDIVINDDSLILPIFARFMVVTTNWWDSMFSTDYLDVNVFQIGADASSATNLARATRCLTIGTIGSGSTTTTLVSGLTTTADQYNGRIVTFAENTTTAALRGQSTDITDTDASGNLTVTALTASAVSGDTYTIS